MFWTALDPPVRPKNLPANHRAIASQEVLPSIRPYSGDGNQGVYLASIPETVFDAVVAGTVFDHVLLAKGGANRLTFQIVKDELDDRVESIIKSDATLLKTPPRQP